MYLVVLIAAVWAQEGVNCDAICNERVQQAIQPIQEEKVRAEEWGHGVRRELDEAYNKLRAAEEKLRTQTEEHQRRATELEQATNGLRANLETAQRELEESRRTLEQVRHDHNVEVDELRTKAEESARSLGQVQFALDEANDHIKEMESARISINLKGIADDVNVYWKKLIAFWTGVVMPDKTKDEDL